jgi:hypothetical protein
LARVEVVYWYIQSSNQSVILVPSVENWLTDIF